MNSTIVFLFCFITYVAALKCYQGSQNTTYPLSGVATDCTDPYARTCIKQYDSGSKFATRTCSNANCTVSIFPGPSSESHIPMFQVNGGLVNDNVCVNVSSYQTNCCCYTDGCNAAPSTVLTFSVVAAISAAVLSCFLKH